MSRAIARTLTPAVLLLVVPCLAAVALAAAAEPALEAADGLPPGLPDSLSAALAQPGHRVTRDGGVLAELWVRREPPPVGGVNEGALGVEFGALASSVLVGVVHFPETWIDYRDTELPPGVYTMRYWVQPADGDHMGVSQYRDFLLLSPAADDGDAEAVFEQEPLLELSQKASGRVHPAVIALFPVYQEPAGGAALVHNDLDQLMLAVEGPDRTYGFVLEGHGELP
ncbi:MAG TPA: hypothetical protein VMS86_06605 [Thermoanaerobaculia bacterium]|nr:hypothetical protein [Thermoanaerobaculia bacterium]